MDPDFQHIEAHIRRARAERSLYVAECIADSIFAISAGLGELAARIHSIARQGKAKLARA